MGGPQGEMGDSDWTQDTHRDIEGVSCCFSEKQRAAQNGVLEKGGAQWQVIVREFQGGGPHMEGASVTGLWDNSSGSSEGHPSWSLSLLPLLRDSGLAYLLVPQH